MAEITFGQVRASDIEVGFVKGTTAILEFTVSKKGTLAI
jgi:hypothetical protein